MVYKLLICGSREATIPMLRLAERAVERAKANGWTVVCGDAEGVDHAVIKACCKLDVPFEFYGVKAWPRHYCCYPHLVNYTPVPGDYYRRDREMCHKADRCFCVWNGVSRGSKYTADYMVKLGKPTDIRGFKAEQWQQMPLIK